MNKKILIFIIISVFLISCISLKTKKNISIDYYNLGNNYLELKDYENAIKSYEKSLEYDAFSEQTILNLILSYQYNKNFEKVEKLIYKHYKKTNNEFTKKLIMLLGNNFYLQKDYDKAIKTYLDYLEIYPDDTDCYFNLGLTYLKISNENSALNSFLKVYELDNKHIKAIYNIAEYYCNIKNYKESFHYFLLLSEIENENPDISYRLAELEYNLNEFEEAKKHLLESLDKNPDNTDYNILMAQIYSKGYNDKDKTLKYLENAFENGFDDMDKLNQIKEFKILNEFYEYKKLLKKYNL